MGEIFSGGTKMIVTNRDGGWYCPNSGEWKTESVYVYDGGGVACQK